MPDSPGARTDTGTRVRTTRSSTDSPRETAAEAVRLLRSGPPKLLARALLVHAQSLGGWHADEARSIALQALELAERNDLTSLAVELHATVAGLDPEGGGHLDVARPDVLHRPVQRHGRGRARALDVDHWDEGGERTLVDQLDQAGLAADAALPPGVHQAVAEPRRAELGTARAVAQLDRHVRRQHRASR